MKLENIEKSILSISLDCHSLKDGRYKLMGYDTIMDETPNTITYGTETYHLMDIEEGGNADVILSYEKLKEDWYGQAVVNGGLLTLDMKREWNTIIGEVRRWERRR